MKNRQIIICFVLLLSIKGFARSDYAVLVQERPVGAGEINPGIGVLTFNADETVTLTTMPKPGWHFVYWLGDVSDPTTNRTSFTADGPKIIIAVFQRNEYEMLDEYNDTTEGTETTSLIRRYDAIGGGLGSGTTGGGGGGGYNPPDNPPDEDPPPVPDVPEPATVLLLGIGSAFLVMNRKK